MDLKIYYQKIREMAEKITEKDVVVVSLETSDGGKAGVRTEVPKRLGAKLVVDGRARMATAEEAAKFREEQAEAKRMADQLHAASRMQIAVLSSAELSRLKGMRPKE